METVNLRDSGVKGSSNDLRGLGVHGYIPFLKGDNCHDSLFALLQPNSFWK